MNIKINVLPERDTHNSFPEEVEFLIDSEESIVELTLDDRTISFKQEDIARLVKAFSV